MRKRGKGKHLYSESRRGNNKYPEEASNRRTDQPTKKKELAGMQAFHRTCKLEGQKPDVR
jgi:hypothetical protein